MLSPSPSKDKDKTPPDITGFRIWLKNSMKKPSNVAPKKKQNAKHAAPQSEEQAKKMTFFLSQHYLRACPLASPILLHAYPHWNSTRSIFLAQIPTSFCITLL